MATDQNAPGDTSQETSQETPEVGLEKNREAFINEARNDAAEIFDDPGDADEFADAMSKLFDLPFVPENLERVGYKSLHGYAVEAVRVDPEKST